MTIRTCVACRSTGERDDLVRLARGPDGVVVLDYRARLPGSGAWVHPQRDCVAKLERRPGILTRAFGRDPELGPIGDQLRDAVVRAVLDGLSFGAAAGALVGGRDVLERALQEERVVEVVVAADASARTVGDLRRVADAEMPFTVVPLGKEELGARLGRGSRAAVGIVPSRATSHLRRQLRRLRLLG